MPALAVADIEKNVGIIIYEDAAGLLAVVHTGGISIFFKIDDTEEYESVTLIDVQQTLLKMPLESIKQEVKLIAEKIHSGKISL